MIIKKKYGYLLALILVVGLVMVFMRWNEYREKELVDVVDWEDLEEFVYLETTEDSPLLFDETPINDPEAMKELLDFFGQYKVKKLQDEHFSAKYPDEQFHFRLTYTDERITVPSMIERDVLLFHLEEYTITNGPVDYAWLEDFFEIEN